MALKLPQVHNVVRQIYIQAEFQWHNWLARGTYTDIYSKLSSKKGENHCILIT